MFYNGITSLVLLTLLDCSNDRGITLLDRGPNGDPAMQSRSPPHTTPVPNKVPWWVKSGLWQWFAQLC